MSIACSWKYKSYKTHLSLKIPKLFLLVLLLSYIFFIVYLHREILNHTWAKIKSWMLNWLSYLRCPKGKNFTYNFYQISLLRFPASVIYKFYILHRFIKIIDTILNRYKIKLQIVIIYCISSFVYVCIQLVIVFEMFPNDHLLYKLMTLKI